MNTSPNFPFQTKADTDLLRYPIGKLDFQPGQAGTRLATYAESMQQAAQEYAGLKAQVENTAWDQPYRPGGWTARQVVYHMVDAQWRGYLRFKDILLNPGATIQAYDENLWVTKAGEEGLALADAIDMAALSVKRFGISIAKADPAALVNTGFHTERKINQTAENWLQIYTWHAWHHLGHIELVIK